MRLALLSLAALVFLSGSALAQDDPSEPKLQELIKQLGADEYEAREAAQQAIEKMGRKILPKLEKELEAAEDMEVRARLKDIIDKFKEPPRPAKKEEPKKPNRPGMRIQRVPAQFRNVRGDPKKALEEMQKILKKMEEVLENKDLTDDQKLEQMKKLSMELYRASYKARIMRVPVEREKPRGKEDPKKPKKIPTKKTEKKKKERGNEY